MVYLEDGGPSSSVSHLPMEGSVVVDIPFGENRNLITRDIDR